MKAYGIDYIFNDSRRTITIDAKDAKSAKKKLATKHKCGIGKIKIEKISVIGYF